MAENYFVTFLCWLQKIEPLFLFLTVILMAVYVYCTIKTFREIKRQTDLQSEAFLVVAARSIPEINEGTKLIADAQAISDKWRNILQKQLPDAIQNEDFLELEFSNRGKSDVIDWKITITVNISAEKFLAKTYNIAGETKTWVQNYSGYKDNIPTDTKIKVPIAGLGVFPSAEFRWQIEYTDIRNIKYKRFAGDSNFKDTNILANPKK